MATNRVVEHLDVVEHVRGRSGPGRVPNNEAEELVVAMRRVRNNLFHGGKEDPLEEPYPGDDEEWAVAAGEVTGALLDLLNRGVLRPLAPVRHP